MLHCIVLPFLKRPPVHGGLEETDKKKVPKDDQCRFDQSILAQVKMPAGMLKACRLG